MSSRILPRAVVLFVEADAQQRRLLATLLNGHAFFPIAVAAADEALLVLGSIRPSIVAIVRADELEPLVLRLRADRRLRQVPTLAFASRTAMATELVPTLEAMPW